MYREFGITGIYSELANRSIRIEFTLDVDPDSAPISSLVLCEKDTGKITPCNVSINKKVITMHLQEWPVAEKEYLLRIQAGIRSIVDDELSGSLQRVIVFKSEVLSSVNILYPSQHEVLRNTFVKWEEIAEKEDSLIFSYRLEIAKENAFYNIVRSSLITDKQEIELSDLESGQYYIRMRSEKNGSYGKWSEIITFIVSSDKQVIEEEEDIYIKDLELISKPENGETPSSFIFVFDEEIDIDELPEIVIKRRSI